MFDHPLTTQRAWKKWLSFSFLSVKASVDLLGSLAGVWAISILQRFSRYSCVLHYTVTQHATALLALN